MWSALKSDLNEFVTTVKDESSTVLKTENTSGEDNSRVSDDSSQQQQEGGSGIIMGEDGEVIYEDVDGGAVLEEIDRLVREEETFTDPLEEEEDDEEVTAFLVSFNVEEKTDDISKLLEENPETLQVQFESLVPTHVSYKEFWQRYYFRCDADRIQRQWQEEEEAARKAREEAIANTVQGVKNLFGGAVKAVSSTLQAADDGVDAVTTTTPFESMPPPTGAGAGFFGASGRPPFVMNTAVDEDDDEEEEELGWDDDEEEDEDDYEEGESEEITFSGGKNEEIEKLTEQLSQAMEERDQLHNTVEMQAQEISRLQSGDDTAPPTKATDNALQKLKMELFEKDSELAALKASLEDTHDDSKESATKKDSALFASQGRELEQLRGALATKESELAQLVSERDSQMKLSADKEAKVVALREALEGASSEVERLVAEYDAEKAANAATSAEKEELAMQVTTLREQLESSQSEAEMLRQTVETRNSGTQSQVSTALEEASAAKAQVESLTLQVEELKGNLHFATGRAEHLERELQEAKDALKKQEAEFSAKLTEEIAKVHAEHEQLSSGTQNSESTGVKVAGPKEEEETTPTAAVTKLDDEEDMDDWGDDWGDEED